MIDMLQPTTSINWWPRPAGGVPSPNVASPPPPPATSTPLLLITVAPPSHPPLPPNTASTMVTSTPSNTTSLPSTGIISITALPPLDPTAVPTPVTYPKKVPESQQKFKLIYLAPVFVVLGVIWGSVSAWFVYGCMTRRPKITREDELIGGPRYAPAASGEGDVEGGALLRDDMHEEVFSWPDLCERAKVGNEKRREDDPFLAPPPPSSSKYKSMRTKSAQSTLTEFSDATYMLDTDDEGRKEDDVPWESLRHKSIKRGILEEVQKEGSRIHSLRPVTGTSLRSTGTGNHKRGKTIERRPTRHTRADSDLLVGDIDLLLPDRATLRSTERSSRPPSRRADSSYTTTFSVDSSVATTPGDKTQWKPGAGFRIVAESPAPSSREPTPQPPEDIHHPAMFDSNRWGGGGHVDRYTPLPVGHHDSRSRSRSSSPLKSGAETEPSVYHDHASVLPQSPPQITSPLLVNKLCFTPMPAARTRMPGTARTTPTKVRDSDRGRKLWSPKLPPLPLPFPDCKINSPRPDMSRGRVVRPRAKTVLPPMTSNASSSSAGSSASYTRDAEGRAVIAAIKKVESIVERSWGARELGEEGVRSLSPTGFGRRAGG